MPAVILVGVAMAVIRGSAHFPFGQLRSAGFPESRSGNCLMPAASGDTTIGGDGGNGMKIERAFWMEHATRATWAVELRDDVVAACYGPLLPEDLDDDLLETFDYGQGGAAWIELNRERFGAIKPAVPEIPEA